MRELTALPVHLGGLGVINPKTYSSQIHTTSKLISAPIDRTSCAPRSSTVRLLCSPAVCQSGSAIHKTSQPARRFLKAAEIVPLPPAMLHGTGPIKKRTSTGYLCHPSIVTGLHCTRQHSRMPCHFGMIGHRRTRHPTAAVVIHSMWNMHALSCPIRGFPPLGIMRRRT